MISAPVVITGRSSRNGGVGYSNRPNAPLERQSPATQPLLFLDALEDSPLTSSTFRRADPASEGITRETRLVKRPLFEGLERYSGTAVTW